MLKEYLLGEEKRFQYPLSTINKTSRLKISKAGKYRNINQPDVVDIYKTIHPQIAEYSLISMAHGTFTKIDYIIGQKTNLDGI